jgi:hypothetical protein
MSNRARFATVITALMLVPLVTRCSTMNDSYATGAHPQASLHDGMRKLWADHVAYTRLFIVSTAAGAPDKDATTERLLQNQNDIGNAVAEYYGRDAGNQLTALLRDHILIAANIVTAAKAGDNAKVTSENARWRSNATDIARFLHGANPNQWPEATLQSAMFMHLDQTLSEATNELEGNYAESIKDYDRAMDHMLMVADTLTNGIVAQFPAKF